MTVAVRKLSTTAFTVELSGEVAEKLALAAAAHGTSAEELIAGATEQFLADDAAPHDDWSPEDVAAIERGIAQLRRGEKVRQEDMMARLKAKFGG